MYRYEINLRPKSSLSLLNPVVKHHARARTPGINLPRRKWSSFLICDGKNLPSGEFSRFAVFNAFCPYDEI